MKLKRSPINYLGGKFRSLSYIKPHMPSFVEGTFYDIFGGSGTVSLNVDANKYVYNDRIVPVAELFEWVATTNHEESFDTLQKITTDYDLLTREGFISLRADYNADPSPEKLLALSSFSFSYLIRFNKAGGFNASWGKGHCKLGGNMLDKLRGTYEHFLGKDVSVLSKDFREVLDLDQLKKEDFIYLDPPYEISEANYNENGGYTGWTNRDALDVYDLAKELLSRDIPFGYSNSLFNKGVTNEHLLNFMEEYKDEVFVISKGINLRGIKTGDLRKEKDIEVYITNV